MSHDAYKVSAAYYNIRKLEENLAGIYVYMYYLGDDNSQQKISYHLT